MRRVEGEGGGEVECDSALVSWGGVFSRWARLASEFLAPEANMYHVAMYNIVMEPIRWLTSLYLASAARPHRPNECPLVVDLSSWATSLVARVLEYYSALLSGQHRRCELV